MTARNMFAALCLLGAIATVVITLVLLHEQLSREGLYISGGLVAAGLFLADPEELQALLQRGIAAWRNRGGAPPA